MTMRRRDSDKAVSIIADAGGELVGRTRLQKIGIILELAGEGEGFEFEYKHYGPYSEHLATAISDAVALEKMAEIERTAQWGGRYSIFRTDASDSEVSDGREKLIALAKDADSIVLELAATAAFLASEGSGAAWDETENLKLSKAADGRLGKAKQLYAKFLKVETSKPLPRI